jgi:signal transduction histidine kinase
VGLAALLVVLFLAVAGGAFPVVRRLTRRLESLKQGVEAFGAGALHQRVAEDGQDEVAAVGVSFNRAATRIEALVRSHQSLLANASHELRSPLARLKMAVQMLEDAARRNGRPAPRNRHQHRRTGRAGGRSAAGRPAGRHHGTGAARERGPPGPAGRRSRPRGRRGAGRQRATASR